MFDWKKIQRFADSNFSKRLRKAAIGWIITSAGGLTFVFMLGSLTNTQIGATDRIIGVSALILISISLLLASNFVLPDGGSNTGGLSNSPWQKQGPFVSICFGWVVWSAILAVNIHWLLSPGFLLVSFFLAAVTTERRLKIQYSQAQSDENENKLDDKLAPQTDLFQLDAPQLDVQLDEPSLDQLAIQQELDQELEYVTEDEIVEEAEDFPAEVIQQVTRIKNENGESMVAYVRQRFEAGQLLRVIHVPFHPPMNSPPTGNATQIEGPEVTTKITHANKFGIRAECRIAQSPTHPVDILLEFSLTETEAHRLNAAG